MTTKSLTDVQRGDTLVLVEYRKDDRTVYVARVGRNYLYITATPDGREMDGRFHRDTGIEDTKIGWKAVLCTPEQYEERSVRSGLLAELRSAGIEILVEVRPDMSTHTLVALLAVVRPREREAP